MNTPKRKPGRPPMRKVTPPNGRMTNMTLTKYDTWRIRACDVDESHQNKPMCNNAGSYVLDLEMPERPRLISLFSGCGGMDLGFKKAGFDIVFANDFDSDAQAIYSLNLGNIDRRDILSVGEDEFLLRDSRASRSLMPEIVKVSTILVACYIKNVYVLFERRCRR